MPWRKIIKNPASRSTVFRCWNASRVIKTCSPKWSIFYSKRLPICLPRCAMRWKRGEMGVLERSAHSLKGAAGNLSAKTAAAAASRLEEDAKNKDAESAKNSLVEVERAVKNLAPGPRRTLPGSFEMKILIADDESLSRRMLQGLLGKWGYEVVAVEDGDSAWEKLKAADAPRMALLDWMMPGQNGVDVCRALRKLRPEPYTYILLLTAKDAKESVVEGLESGADDYLTKPFHSQELKARIRVGLRLLDLEDNLVQAREAMRFKATHDTLTSVWNRGAILETLDREVWRSRREGLSLGILMVDMDHFKSVNDTYGHLAGDAVLREVTKRMQANIRPYDAVGRYGGEEFLVLLPGCSGSATREKSERVREMISRESIETPSGALKVTISVGCVATTDWPEDTPNQFLQMVDLALYRAKEDGRNRTVQAGAAEHEEAHHSSLASQELSTQGTQKE
jgi:two-component system cell cycle response regulator